MTTYWISSYQANSKMRPHSHDESHFTVVLKGGYEEVIAGETSRHHAGSMLFYPAGQAHSQRFGDAGSRGLMFMPPPSCLEVLSEQKVPLDRASHLKGGTASHLVRRFLIELRREDPFTELTLNGLFFEFIGLFGWRQKLSGHEPVPTWLIAVRERIQDESGVLWTNEELARGVGRHPVHLARAFRKHYGETIGEFQRRLRLQKAEKLVTSTHISLLDITFECGFSSQAHFSRSFKDTFGMSPSEYRSQSS